MALIVVQRSMAVLLCLAIREVGGVSSTGVGRQSHPPAGKLENSRFLRQGVMTHGAKQMVEDENHINSHTISRASVVDLGLGGEPSYGKIPGVENMVLSMLKQRRTPTMDSFVHTVEALIGDMTEQLLKDHNVSQAYIDLVAGNVSTCSSSASFSSFEKSYADTLPLHRPCREAESGLKAVYDACVARVAADCDSKTAWCAAYDTLNVEPNKEECTANAENREAWLRRLQTEFTTKYDTLISKKTKCENYTILCQQPCDGTALSAKTAECDGFLNTIESSACQWASGMKSLRDGSQSCYDGKKQAYEDAEAATQILEADRKVQYRALQRLLCLLGALGNATAGQAPDAAVIDSCKAATHTGDVLTISYPLLPGYTTPPAPTKYPCTSAYEADVYTDLPSSVTVRACASSTACPAMTPTTTTTTTTMPSDPDAAHLVAEFNVGQPPIVLPHTPELLFAPESGFFGFDQARVMWKIEWKCRFAEVPHRETIIMSFPPGSRKIWYGNEVETKFMGSAHMRTNWTPDTNPHVYVLEWSAAAGSSMSVDGVVMDSNPNQKLEMGTGTWSTGLTLGHGQNIDMEGEWYYTKVYIA